MINPLVSLGQRPGGSPGGSASSKTVAISATLDPSRLVIRFQTEPRVDQIFTLLRFAGGSSLSEGRTLPGEAPTLPLARLAGG